MRIVDLLRPYEEGLERIADETPRSINLRRHIFASDAIAYEWASPGSSGEVAPRTIVFSVLGPDREQHGDPEAIESVISRLRSGARAVILFGWEPAELPYHRILDLLTANQCQVLQVAAVDLGSIRAAAVIERVDELKPPRDPVGAPMIAQDRDGTGLATQLRMANEYAFGEFASRVLRATVLDPARGVEQKRFNAYRAQMELEVKERDARIQGLETKLENLRSSTSLKVGQTLVGAARSPVGLLRLPLDLVRIWRARG